jgi:hypothetical protein
MNWEAFGAISEALGVMAVFVTLGYLSVQVRQAKRELSRSIQQARADGMRQVWLTQAGQPELAAAFAKFFAYQGVHSGPFAEVATAAGLSEGEARQVYASLWASWTHYEQMIESLGDLTEGGRNQFNATLRFALGNAGPSGAWYQSVRARLNPTAVKYVEDLLAESTAGKAG